MTPRGRKRIPVWLAVVVLLAAAGLALALRYESSLRFTLALALPATEGWLRFETPAREEVTIPGDGGSLSADLYRPGQPRGALLLVHGLSRAGRRHPELARLARLLAEHGRLVLVPEFVGLTRFGLSGKEVEEIRVAIRFLRGLGHPVGVAGFSFGAGPALLAAADDSSIPLVGSFGGYADLRHVITYISTGVHEFRGLRYVQHQEEYNRWKLLALLAGFAEDERDRRLLEAIGERKLANPSESTGALEGGLGTSGRSVLALVLNRDEKAVEPLMARLPSRARETFERLSPLPVAPRLPGRLLIAHGTHDDSIPFTESLRLAEAAGGRARVAILQSFHHLGPQPFWAALRHWIQDGWNLLRLVDDLLAEP